MRREYDPRYNTPEWRALGVKMRELGKHQCSNCGARGVTFEVHHPVYIKNRQLWEYEPDELRLLCEPCHDAAHVKIDRMKQMLARTKRGDLDSFLAGRLTFDSKQHADVLAAAYEASPHTYTAGAIGGLCDEYIHTRDDMLRVGAFIAELSNNPRAIAHLAAIESKTTFEEPT